MKRGEVEFLAGMILLPIGGWAMPWLSLLSVAVLIVAMLLILCGAAFDTGG